MGYQEQYSHPPQADPRIQVAGLQYERDPGARYGDHIKNTGAICNTSAAHTYGNVLSLVEKYLLETFPQDMFKTVTASTTLASRQVTHTPRQLHKKELPLMVVVPRIVFGQEENRFLAHTLMNDQMVNTHALWGDGSLLPLGEDPRKRLYIHGHYKRAVMYVDVILTYNTYTEQQNARSIVDNMFRVGHPQGVEAPLELYIPEGFCNLISQVAKIPIRKEDRVYDFLTYMNTVWHYPITYKLKSGSNTDEFFMYYLTPIDLTVQDPSMGEGIRDGQIRRGFTVTFTVRCDFNTIGYFTLNHPDIKRQVLQNASDDNNAIIPIFSDSINLNDFKLPIGWSILSWPIFKLKKGENTISIDPILNESLRVVIDYHLKTGIPMSRFIDIQFRQNGEIIQSEMFHIDWAKRELVLLRPDPRRTYRLIITVSQEYVNGLIKELYNFE